MAVVHGANNVWTDHSQVSLHRQSKPAQPEMTLAV